MFIYPVSGIMKLCHLLFHQVLGWNDNLSWSLSIIGLIIVVRGIIAPLQWMIYKSGRISVIMRPAMKDLEEQYATSTDYQELKEKSAAEKQLRKEYGHKASAGCIPPLLQIPVFMGLYQVLLRMARPAEGLDSTVHAPIGFLSSKEASAFVAATFHGVPMPAYLTMSPEQFAYLGTTREAVYAFIFPMVIVSAVVTFLNLGASVVRNVFILDYASKLATGSARLLLLVTLTVPFLLVYLGLYSPVPAAIAVYWVANNLWTLLQNLAIYVGLFLRLPLSDEVKAHQRQLKETYKEQRRELHSMRLGRTGLAGSARRAEAAAFFAQRKATAAQTKAEKKHLRALRNASRKEHYAGLRQERRDRAQAKKQQSHLRDND